MITPFFYKKIDTYLKIEFMFLNIKYPILENDFNDSNPRTTKDA